MPRRVIIAYHFFAHYREAVIRELLNDPELHCTLVSDQTMGEGERIPPMGLLNETNHVTARCFQFRNNVMFQPGLISVAAFRNYDALVLLGDAHFIASWIAAAIGRLRRRKVLYWTHGWTKHDKGIIKPVRILFYKLGHALMLYGHCAKKIAIDAGFDPSRLHVIYNSLDYEKQIALRKLFTGAVNEETRASIFGSSTLPIVVTIGRLIRSRGVDLLLCAVAQLKKEGNNVELLVIGDGPETENLKARARELNITPAFVGGCYEEAALARLIRCADIAVLPGKAGLSVMHALAYGIPVIVPGGFENQAPEWEAVDPGKNGDLFEPGNAGSLTKVLRSWVTSPGRCAAAATECIRTIEERYNPKTEAELIKRAVLGEPADDLAWRSIHFDWDAAQETVAHAHEVGEPAMPL